MTPALDLALALDPVAFARRVGLEPDPWQAQMLRSTTQNLIVCCSRQVGKSTTAAVKALHRVLFWPGSLVILVSKAQRQSGELFRKVVELLGHVDPRPTMVEENKLSLQLEDGGRIVSLPGNADTIRGFSGVSMVLEDEAAFVRDDLYASVRPMLATTRGQLVLMSTPFGKRGHFFEAWENGGAAWERISIPATQCPRITPEFLEQERAALGEWRFRQEFLCQFVEGSDQFFAHDDVMRALSPHVAPLFGTSADATRAQTGITSTVAPLFGGAT